MPVEKLWVKRKFNFAFPEERYTDLIKRLKNTPAILEKLVLPVPEQVLLKRDTESWSIKENTGHLFSVDTLFIGRLEDYQNRLEELRPADMSNKRTKNASYNDSDIKTILSDFQSRRMNYINDLETLDAAEFGRSAFHPRLKKQMRLCDMLFFQAEHDDHHIKRIEELIEKYNPS